MTIAVDFDGTVANSMPALEELAVRLTMDATGRDESDVRDWYVTTAGSPFVTQVEALGEYPVLVARFENLKMVTTTASPPWRDVGELAAITEDLVLVSSTTHGLLERYLNQWELKHLFQAVAGWSPQCSKTGQILLYGTRALIGDTRRDQTYAAWAGVDFWPLQRDPRYLDAGHANLADLVAEVIV